MIISHQTPANLLHKSYGHGSDMSPADTLFDFKKKKKQLRVTSTSYSRPHWPPTQQYLFQNKQLLTKPSFTPFKTILYSISRCNYYGFREHFNLLLSCTAAAYNHIWGTRYVSKIKSYFIQFNSTYHEATLTLKAFSLNL